MRLAPCRSPESATDVIHILLHAHVLNLWAVLVAKAVRVEVVDVAHVNLDEARGRRKLLLECKLVKQM